MFNYKIIAKDGKARVGEFTTPHGSITTPVFMPVGTHGAVKSVSPQELRDIGSQIILGNTYHLYLRPGDQTIAQVGGLHQFMAWLGPILTDSGGFQVFSLGERGMSGNEKKSLRKVTEDGIEFQSHLDGSKHLFTAEKSIQIQNNLGADIIIAFDQPVYGMSTEESSRGAMERSQRWLERSKAEWQKNKTNQALFGIVQGGVYKDLHSQSARHLATQDLPGNAIGGLSVGESKAEMWKAVESINKILPEEKPRYFMGLGGEPLDLLNASIRGVDMYDCVAPTRLARHGVVWQATGEPKAVEAFYRGDVTALLTSKTLTFTRCNLHNQKYHSSIDKLNPYQPEYADFNLSTISHYIKENEMLGFRIASIHNILVLNLVVAHTRDAIKQGRVGELAMFFGVNIP